MKQPSTNTHISTDDYQTARSLAEREHRRAMRVTCLGLTSWQWCAIFVMVPFVVVGLIIFALALMEAP